MHTEWKRLYRRKRADAIAYMVVPQVYLWNCAHFNSFTLWTVELHVVVTRVIMVSKNSNLKGEQEDQDMLIQWEEKKNPTGK